MESNETINALKRQLNGSHSFGATKIFPTFFATVGASAFSLIRHCGMTIEDLAIACFRNLGLSCDRTRKNLNGYPGLFRDLNSPPPWIEVTMDDVDGSICEERELELQPLYMWVSQYSNEQLYEFYRRQSAERNNALNHLLGIAPVLQVVSGLSTDAFAEKVELARCLGADDFPELLECVLSPYDEFTTAVGAPDLLVWSQQHNLWFFAEVKGPGDSLKPSQVAWLNANWDIIGGRFVLVAIHEDGSIDG